MSSNHFLFIPPTLPLRSRSPSSSLQTRHPSLFNHRPSPFRCCATPSTPLPSQPPTPSPAVVDKLFSRLGHLNKNLRKKASYELSELASPDTISRLASLLHLSNTDHRRAAVQSLGMTGMRVLPTVLPRLRDDPDPTVRASCSKVLAAVALYFPEDRLRFPEEALDLLEAVLKGGVDVDPVTKIASVGCLGTLGCDVREKDGTLVHKGCKRAGQILLDLCGEVADMAVGATAVGAVAQIGQNADKERKLVILAKLKTLAEGGGRDEGFDYLKEMAASHVEQLEGATRVPEE